MFSFVFATGSDVIMTSSIKGSVPTFRDRTGSRVVNQDLTNNLSLYVNLKETNKSHVSTTQLDVRDMDVFKSTSR